MSGPRSRIDVPYVAVGEDYSEEAAHGRGYNGWLGHGATRVSVHGVEPHAAILRDVTIRFNEMRALKRTLADVARTSTNIA